VHGAAWYQQTKPKTTKKYYQESRKKMWQMSGLESRGNTLPDITGAEQTYHDAMFPPRMQAGSHQQRPLSPGTALATYFSPRRRKSPVGQLTHDDASSLLFLPHSVQPSQDSHENLFGQRYKTMLASSSHKMPLSPVTALGT
jgi:hypothetical protein